ncbi:MAG: tRNA uridine(34) 5-carboxymethylaminomethyl modification radical SAM/GNAT enzyme Elp3 [Candidatus Pacearchaeota archaeon]|jgi:elongator complex protein 3|nr:tRNA uridine(34) 5-carboxymethylaminomethyl modification radical SAM/GNAT enzyme Elp3 [Candidatus Pacearchaeota archaeon]|tara:strand:- start:785 stop:2149 length:1365 start_codon:yes stop_codon:yes gene_type:complete
MLKPKKNEIRKPTKTISGITPVAVMLPPRSCKHGTCLYCPSLDVPQSYTPKSPVVMRARIVNYNSYKQVKARIRAFQVMNHPTDKIELIIMGGTFLEYPRKFQYEFIKKCYDAMNNKISKTLEQAKRLNEKAKHRCVALCIETRPDRCSNSDIKKILEFGATRVELGVQIIDDEIYKKNKRGHTVKDVIDATKRLRDAGFKISYHIMPGLPGTDPKKDLKLFKKIFDDERFRPDQLKIYPCQVIPGADLEKLYWKGRYKPYTKEQTEKILVEMLKIVPRYCRVMRVMREIPPDYLVAGTIKIDLRKDIEEELRKKKTKLKEIRYREIGFALRDKEKINTKLKLKITKYNASNGEEYFLEIINKDDILFGLLRLRLVKNYAIIRELHVYGRSLKIGEKNKLALQHKGLGKWLMNEAEKIAKKYKKISVISGVGVREYYKKLGYKLGENYMVKLLY